MSIQKTVAATRLNAIIEMMLLGGDKLTANRLLRSNLIESDEVKTLNVFTDNKGRNFYYNPDFIVNSGVFTLTQAFESAIKADVEKHHQQVLEGEKEASVIITEFHDTGECPVDISVLIDEWNDDYSLSEWDGAYTLLVHRKDAETYTKVRISLTHAKCIIEKCNLVCHQSDIFRSGRTWK